MTTKSRKCDDPRTDEAGGFSSVPNCNSDDIHVHVQEMRKTSQRSGSKHLNGIRMYKILLCRNTLLKEGKRDMICTARTKVTTLSTL